MKIVTVDKVKLPEVTCLEPEYLTRKTPEGLPPLNFMAVLYASMGAGKTVALIKLLKLYDKTKSYDKIIWWSPTFSHEPKGKAFLKEKHNFELVHYEKFNNTDFVNEVAGMTSAIEEYREYMKRKTVWEKYVRNDYNVDSMTYDELIMLHEQDFDPPQTKYKWGFPSFAIVFDDVIFDKSIFSANCKNATSQFFIAHRHHSCCVFITSQVHANGVPRQIRGVISLWMLFRCKSKELQEAIAKELSFKCDKETLIKVWDFATSPSPHDFLYIDYKQNDLNQMFRRNFDQQIVLDGDEKNDLKM